MAATDEAPDRARNPRRDDTAPAVSRPTRRHAPGRGARPPRPYSRHTPERIDTCLKTKGIESTYTRRSRRGARGWSAEGWERLPCRTATSTSAANSCLTLSNGAVSSSRRGMTTTSSGAGSPATRNTSRIRRLARLRSTAPPIFLLAAMPRRARAADVGSTKTDIRRPCRFTPPSNTPVNSPRRRMRAARGNEAGMNGARPIRLRRRR